MLTSLITEVLMVEMEVELVLSLPSQWVKLHVPDVGQIDTT